MESIRRFFSWLTCIMCTLNLMTIHLEVIVSIGCFQIFTWEMVGKSQTSIEKIVVWSSRYLYNICLELNGISPFFRVRVYHQPEANTIFVSRVVDRPTGIGIAPDSNQGYNPHKWVICPLTRVINLHITSY